MLHVHVGKLLRDIVQRDIVQRDIVLEHSRWYACEKCLLKENATYDACVKLLHIIIICWSLIPIIFLLLFMAGMTSKAVSSAFTSTKVVAVVGLGFAVMLSVKARH